MTNREIKFRGWSKKLQKMFYYNSWFTLHALTVLCFEEEKGHHYVDESDIDYPERITLMQFTGLKDRLGRDVYEGDVVKHYDVGVYGEELCNPYIGQIIFEAPTFIVQPSTSPPRGYYPFSSIETIGNLFETPDLLNNQ